MRLAHIILMILASFFVVIYGTGCLSAGREPIERGINTVVTQVIAPAVAKCAEELRASTAQLQGQGSLINPGYVIKGFATAGPATTFEFEIHAVGVSANIAGATQGAKDEGGRMKDEEEMANGE
jgi:hypothetical protein